MNLDVERYLDRIAFEGRPNVDLPTLDALQRAHLTSIPFENLDVYDGVEVSTDPAHSLEKILDRGRGGWCFELNGAFALLLEAIGFRVNLLGAAVLLGGPTEVIDHLCLEVMLDEPYLVDVGFGDSFCRPLALNRPGPQDGRSGVFELMPGAQGTTLTRELDGVPSAQYRFKRVNRRIGEFEPASRNLQDDKSLNWHRRAFATRLIDGGPDRVTLVGNQLKFERAGERTTTDIADDEWHDTLTNWFGIDHRLSGPPRRTIDQ